MLIALCRAKQDCNDFYFSWRCKPEEGLQVLFRKQEEQRILHRARSFSVRRHVRGSRRCPPALQYVALFIFQGFVMKHAHHHNQAQAWKWPQQILFSMKCQAGQDSKNNTNFNGSLLANNWMWDLRESESSIKYLRRSDWLISNLSVTNILFSKLKQILKH